MSKILRYIIMLVFALCCIEQASAQYYSWGADPAHFKWRKAETDQATVIYPEHASEIGLTTLYLTERIKPSIQYGYKLPPLDLPFVVHPENLQSNGLVMWLPKRVEFLSSPAIDGYSMPWLKQLTAHEFRHAVQYNNINVGFIKFLSYLLGEQSSTIGLVFMPLWMMEGDATLFETQVSSFGRGLQPRFTLEFRAMGDIANKYRNTDKFFCGSYKDFIPDHYQLGYQLMSYGNELMGRNIANDMASYGPRHPWTIVSSSWRMNKLFGFNDNTLFRLTFRDLAEYWASLPYIEDTSTRLPAPRFTSYTKYESPIWAGQENIIALKQDLDTPQQFVLLDSDTGFEQRLAYTGKVSTRPVYDQLNKRLWWTEYRRSMMFQQKVSSTLCYMDLEGPKALRPRTVKGRANVLYPAVDDSGNMAWVEYSADGEFRVRIKRQNEEDMVVALPFGQEIHSLAWDNMSRNYYVIITGDEGMWISQIDNQGCVTPVTRAAYVTLSHLRARNGKLYFGSIASGRDEIHCYDIAERKEYQITESTYGSFDAAPAKEDELVMVTYDSLGYHPSVQKEKLLYREVEYSRIPKNVVNPPRKKWDVINLDTVRIDSVSRDKFAGSYKNRRYRKGLTLFNIHSWAPLSYDPFGLTEEGAVNFNIGATVMTQNLLSSMQGFFTYGHSVGNGNIWKASLRYHGLGPTLKFDVTYGGNQSIYRVFTYNPETHKPEFPEEPTLGKYYSVGLSVSFPFLFERGYHTRYLVASAAWNYSNGLIADTGSLKIDKNGISNIATIGYAEGLHLTSFSLGYQDMVAMSHRDFAPPWGFSASASYAINPANGSFSDLLALHAKFYTPGLFRHNSFNVAFAYQTSIGGFKSQDAVSALTFKASKLLLRGFDASQIVSRHYMATSLNYQFPLCYPDGGWRGIFYVKRIRMNLGLDMAQYEHKRFNEMGGTYNRWHGLNSWGGDLTFDVNFISSPASATMALTFSVYRPSEGGLFIAFGADLPF